MAKYWTLGAIVGLAAVSLLGVVAQSGEKEAVTTGGIAGVATPAALPAIASVPGPGLPGVASLPQKSDGVRRIRQPVQEYFTIVTPAGPGRQNREHRVNPFLSYTHIASDFGFVGKAESHIGWAPGMVCCTLPPDPEGWAGMWHSLSRLARMPDEVMDFNRPYPTFIEAPFQPKVKGLTLQAMGRGELKLEIKGQAPEPLWSEKLVFATDRFDPLSRELPTERLTAAKFLNWIAEPGSDLCLDSLGFEVELPPLDYDEYVFLASYAKAARCYGTSTGLVRDRAHTEDGAFDSIPATGLFMLATAAASSRGMVTERFAREVLRQGHHSVRSLAGPYGLLPHFARRSEGRLTIHPGTEYSTVDTAIYYHGALLAAVILNDAETRASVVDEMRKIEFGPLRNSEGYVSHGLRDDRQTIFPYIWKDWGGETALVLLLQHFSSRGEARPMMSDSGRVHLGTGFIAEIQSLFYPDFDQDRPDAVTRQNWRAVRMELLQEQKAYFRNNQPADGFARRLGLFGLSSGEGAYGIGYSVNGTELQRQMIVHPHYVMMSGALEQDPRNVYRFFRKLENENLFPPWGLPENILADGSEHLPMLGGLNATFEAVGAYHLLAKSRGAGTPNVIYQACLASPELREAIRVFYP